MKGRKYVVWIVILGIVNPMVISIYAQNMHGITHQRDTSFTNYSAYTNSRKDYPNIVLVDSKLPSSIRSEQNITYRMIGKDSLKLDVFQPARKHKSLPAILIIHGGGWRSGNKEQHHALAERLAENGYVCFTASYRLSTDALYPAAVKDLKAAIRWIRANAKNHNVDKNKVVALGFSAGAQLATLVGATNGVTKFEGYSENETYSSDVNVIVSIDGILAFIHPDSGEGDDSRSTSAATYWFGYSKDENPELWKEGSALTYAGANTPPTLFINSSLPRFHAGRDDYIKALSKHNIYTEVHELDAPHPFCLFEPWFTPTVNYITSFLKKVL